MLRKLFLITLLLTVLIVRGFAQRNTAFFSRTYSSDQLRTDFDFAMHLIEKVHPSLYRYTSKDSLAYFFGYYRSKIDTSMTAARFWELLEQAVVKIRSGHTEVLPGHGYLDSVNSHDEKIFPFNVLIRNGHIFITNYFYRNDSTLKSGDEILSINGQASGDLLRQLRSCLPADGFSNSFKDNTIELGAFNRAYFFSHPIAPTYGIKIRRGTKTISAQVRLFTIHRSISGSRMNKKLQRYDTRKPELYYPSVLPSTAVLYIADFNYPDFIHVDRDLFRTLRKKKISNLVIDLRNNSGGRSDLTTDLLSYLVNKPCYFIYKYRTVTNIDTLKKYYQLYHSDLSVANAGLLLRNLRRKDSLVIGSASYPHQKPFSGKIYLLINGGTFSAASLFAVSLKLFGNCTTIGSETGGGLTGTDGRDILDVTLPNTRLQLRLPLAFGYTAAGHSGEGRGLMPDCRFDINRHEFYNFRDDGKIYEVLRRVMHQN